MTDMMELTGRIAEMIFPSKKNGDSIIIDMSKIELQKMLMEYAMAIQSANKSDVAE